MKRLILVALALAVVVPLASQAQTAPPIPRPGFCLMVPMRSGSCSFTALTKGTIAYAMQGAVEFRITSGATTTRSCLFGSGSGTGPKVLRGDQVTIIGRTTTTSYFSGLAAGNIRSWTGTGKKWPCT
jgi:hypothetical protein